MQKLYISSWLSDGATALQLVPNIENELELDFSNVEDIKMTDIERLLMLQKIAAFNQISLKVENMKPAVSRIFEQTGLYKMINTLNSPVKLKIRKRQGLAFD